MIGGVGSFGRFFILIVTFYWLGTTNLIAQFYGIQIGYSEAAEEWTKDKMQKLVRLPSNTTVGYHFIPYRKGRIYYIGKFPSCEEAKSYLAKIEGRGIKPFVIYLMPQGGKKNCSNCNCVPKQPATSEPLLPAPKVEGKQPPQFSRKPKPTKQPNAEDLKFGLQILFSKASEVKMKKLRRLTGLPLQSPYSFFKIPYKGGTIYYVGHFNACEEAGVYKEKLKASAKPFVIQITPRGKVDCRRCECMESISTKIPGTNFGKKKPLPSSTSSPAVFTSGEVNRSELIKSAKKFLGTPYRFGGKTPEGFDCSGFVAYIYAQQGVSIVNGTKNQYDVGKKVRKPLKGDLVFFRNTYKRGISHVGIYLGNNEFIHAPGTGKVIRIEPLDISYWRSRIAGYFRYFE